MQYEQYYLIRFNCSKKAKPLTYFFPILTKHSKTLPIFS